jgi:hypothetical protein
MLACSRASATAGVLAYGRNRQQIDRGFRLNRLVHSQTLTLVDKLQVLGGTRRYSAVFGGARRYPAVLGGTRRL